MSLTTYLSPIVSWSVAITAAAVMLPPLAQGFLVGGGSNFMEQAKQEVAYLFSWGRPNSSAMQQPLSGQRVTTSAFGMRKHPITGVDAFHNGTDFRCQVGEPIHAVADGVVASAGDAGNAGLLIAIDHADGMQSLYMHLSSLNVSVGKQLLTGDIIGSCGSTGRSTAPHLHLSIKQGGQFIDPTTKGL